VTGTSSGGRFETTHWSVVVAAGKTGGPEAAVALATLCERYWSPLYAFVRRSGYDTHQARDLTQSFFAVLLEKGYVKDADRTRGRFRTFLLASVRHHLSKERDRERAQKRGGGRPVLSLDFEIGEESYRLEPVDDRTPERVFLRRYALTLLGTVLTRLEDAHHGKGKQKEALFDSLAPFLGGGGPVPTQREVAERLGMTEGAVKVALHRLRRSYRQTLRAEIAETVADPAEVDDEIRELLEAVSL
jgi:RNA polymerase sigma factor (sigma-70 family)